MIVKNKIGATEGIAFGLILLFLLCIVYRPEINRYLVAYNIVGASLALLLRGRVSDRVLIYTGVIYGILGIVLYAIQMAASGRDLSGGVFS